VSAALFCDGGPFFLALDKLGFRTFQVVALTGGRG